MWDCTKPAKMLDKQQSESATAGLEANMNKSKVTMNKHAESAPFRICTSARTSTTIKIPPTGGPC